MSLAALKRIEEEFGYDSVARKFTKLIETWTKAEPTNLVSDLSAVATQRDRTNKVRAKS